MFPSQMRRWIHLVIFGAAIGVAKSASFMKAVILAGLGLAGLWMLHTLAQDFNTIMQSGFGSGGGGDRSNEAKLFNGKPKNQVSKKPFLPHVSDQEIKVFKRSTNEIHEPTIDWERVIKRDPASCARSFICQLAASKESDLITEEKMILNLTRFNPNFSTHESLQLFDF